MNENNLFHVGIICMACVFCVMSMAENWQRAQQAVVLAEFREQLEQHDLVLMDGKLVKVLRVRKE